MRGAIASILAAGLLVGCVPPPRPYTLPGKGGLPPEVVQFPSMESVDIDGIPFRFEFRFRKAGDLTVFDGEATADAWAVKGDAVKTLIRRIAAGMSETRDLGGATGFTTVAFTEHATHSFAYSGKMTYGGLVYEFTKSCNYYRTPRGGGKAKVKIKDVVRDLRAKYGDWRLSRKSTRRLAAGTAEVTEYWWGVDQSDLLCKGHGAGEFAYEICTTPGLDFRRKSLQAVFVDTSGLKDSPDRFTVTLRMLDGYAQWENFTPRR
ncbi:MAG TPA: hypothetical protein VIU29_00725 [Candidatus Deferrimicrobiaceae bacterium]